LVSQMTSESQWTASKRALHKAIVYDDVQNVRRLLADNDERMQEKVDHHGNTVLHWAAGFGSQHAAKFLLDRKADVNAVNTKGWSPITESQYWARQYAVEGGAFAETKASDCMKMQKFLEDRGGRTIGEPETATGTRRRRQNLEQAEQPHTLPENIKNLMRTVKYNELTSLSKGFHNIPRALEVRDGNGATLLHQAAKYGHKRIVSFLLLKHAEVNAIDKRGWSPVTYAVYCAQEAACQGDKARVGLCLRAEGCLKEHGGRQIGHADTSSSIRRRQEATKLEQTESSWGAGWQNAKERASPFVNTDSHPRFADESHSRLDASSVNIGPEDSASNVHKDRRWHRRHRNENEMASETRPTSSWSRTPMPLHEDAAALASDVRSTVSFLSAVDSSHEGQRCFLADAVFETEDGRKKARELDVGSQVYAPDKTLLGVVACRIHEPRHERLVELHAGDAHLIVTGNHRIVVFKNECEQTMLASHIQLGDIVVCSRFARIEVDDIHHYNKEVEVAELRFDPDQPVEVVYAPRIAILSKGQGHGKTRRGGMGRKWSIPNTAREEEWR